MARLALLSIGVLFLFPQGLFAQATADDVAARRVQLAQDLARIEQEIAEQQTLLDAKKTERVSYERDVAILNAQIKTAKLTIQARDLAIRKLTDDIIAKQSTIGSLNAKVDREKESLAQLMRKTEESDNLSIVEVVLGSESLSDFFTDLDSYDSVKIALQSSFDVIANTRASTESAKELVEQKKEDETELRSLQELQKKKIEDQEREKQKIVNQTKGVESTYQKMIATNQRTAAQIRAELFSLRDSAAIPFGKALEYANQASRATGVRPALILGILTQETRLGENLGTGTWTADMHPTRDKPIYPYIMQTLGFDPNKMPVSRAQAGGYGGAMGPGQFIPSTWVCFGGFINTVTGSCSNRKNLTREQFWQGPWAYDASTDRLRKLTGNNRPSNPWEPLDAIMATAVLMADNGAAAGGRAAERLAALRYFAGWTNANKPEWSFYGDGVMEHADYIQSQIDILSKS